MSLQLDQIQQRKKRKKKISGTHLSFHYIAERIPILIRRKRTKRKKLWKKLLGNWASHTIRRSPACVEIATAGDISANSPPNKQISKDKQSIKVHSNPKNTPKASSSNPSIQNPSKEIISTWKLNTSSNTTTERWRKLKDSNLTILWNFLGRLRPSPLTARSIPVTGEATNTSIFANSGQTNRQASHRWVPPSRPISLFNWIHPKTTEQRGKPQKPWLPENRFRLDGNFDLQSQLQKTQSGIDDKIEQQPFPSCWDIWEETRFQSSVQ